jgi:UDP-N-acetylmuramoyl-tripeptide--D-alanyl-D-alanine ligase
MTNMTTSSSTLTSNDILTSLGRTALPRAVEFAEVATDSRHIAARGLFVALPGENHDGASFIADAIRRGANGAIAARLPEGLTEVSVCDLRPGAAALPIDLKPPVVFLAPDALTALQRIAAGWRAKFAVETIGITGSVGKTSTKEMVASVLSRQLKVLKSEGNQNNEIGLPLTLLRLTPSHQRAVLEMGTYGLGEIRLLCDLAKPKIGVVTNVGPTHLERLGSMDRIAEAKAELVNCLPPDGHAVLNGDDPRVRAMADQTPAHVFLYGQEPGFDLWADEIESHGLEGIRLRLHRGRDSAYLQVPLLGEHSVHTVLAAAAVGCIEGLTWGEISMGLHLVPDQLRLVVVPGANGATVIDDTYNSSPASALAALNLLAQMDGRKVAVLGDMMELGAYEDDGHKLVGRRAAAVASILVTVGERGLLIAQEALTSGLPREAVVSARDNAEAIQALCRLLTLGDFVLVKGSRGMKMEEIVQGIRG